MPTDKTAFTSANGKKKEAPAKNSWGTQFVLCELTTEHKEAMKKWSVKDTELMDELDRLVNDGYKISFSRDENHDCVAAFATSPADDRGVRKYTLSARGPGMLPALRCLCYKHFIMLEGKWLVPEDHGKTIDPWG